MNAKDYFDKIAKSYDKWFDNPVGRYVDLTEKRQVFSCLQTIRGLVLDLGCGTGNYTLELKKQGLKVVGLDVSGSMLRVAREKLPQVGLVQADAYHLPFKNQVFDAVLSITLFEFLFKPELALKEISRVLRPKGEVLIGTMNGRSFWFIFKRLKSLFTETAYRYARFYTPNQLKHLLQKYGFQQLETRGVIYLPSFVPKWCLPWALKQDDRWATTALRHLGAFVLVRGIKP